MRLLGRLNGCLRGWNVGARFRRSLLCCCRFRRCRFSCRLLSCWLRAGLGGRLGCSLRRTLGICCRFSCWLRWRFSLCLWRFLLGLRARLSCRAGSILLGSSLRSICLLRCLCSLLCSLGSGLLFVFDALRELFSDPAHYRRFNGRGSRLHKFALLLEDSKKILRGGTELFRKLMHAQFCHNSPVWVRPKQDGQFTFAGSSSLGTHRVPISFQPAFVS